VLCCLALAILQLAGCGGSRTMIQGLPSEEADFLKAKEAYDEGDNVRAIELLTIFVEAHPGSNHLDEALLYLGKAHQKTGENLLSVEHFNRLIRDFPQSEYREQAEFERAKSHHEEKLRPSLDPEETEKALEFARAYLIRYPDGTYVAEAKGIVEDALERLAMKAYLNAQTYRRLSVPAGAVLYAEKAIEIKPDFSRAGEALGVIAHGYEAMFEPEKALDAWKRILDYVTPERAAERGELFRLRQEAESKVAGGAASTSQESEGP
jgi:outer membrane protein assembly factor BamD